MEINRLYKGAAKSKLLDLDSDSIDLVTTVPPGYRRINETYPWEGRPYVWNSLEEYLEYMEKIFSEVFRVLKNQHYCVIVVGDQSYEGESLITNDEKIPLAAYYTTMLTKTGFSYINEIVWDKGSFEVHIHPVHHAIHLKSCQ